MRVSSMQSRLRLTMLLPACSNKWRGRGGRGVRGEAQGGGRTPRAGLASGRTGTRMQRKGRHAGAGAGLLVGEDKQGESKGMLQGGGGSGG